MFSKPSHAVKPLSSKAMFKKPNRSEAELLDFYAEEMSLEWFTTDESEAHAARHVGAELASVHEAESLEELVLAGVIRCIDLVPCFRVIEAKEPKVEEYEASQVCRSYAASTIIFDSAVPEDADEELVIGSAFLLEDDAPALIRSADAVDVVTPSVEATPELLETSDLKVRPTRLEGPLRDAVSQMLDVDAYDQVQETEFEVAVQRDGRSLMRDPPSWSEDDFTDDDESELDDQGKPTKKRKLTQLDRDDGPCSWELEYDRVLRQITGQAFLPGIEHLIIIHARATFLCYDENMVEVQRDDNAPLSDRRDDDSDCVNETVGSVAVLPGEDSSPETNQGAGLSTQYSTADSVPELIKGLPYLGVSVQFLKYESLLDLIAGVVDNASSIENAAPTPPPGVFLDTKRQQSSTYTALEQRTLSPNGPSTTVCAQSAAASVVSDSENKSLILPISELTYFDPDTEQCVAYTALTQLLMHPDDSETLPRIHRAEDGFVEMDVEDIDEIINMYPPTTPQPSSSAQPRSLKDLYSNNSYRANKARWRLQLTVITQLEVLSEKSLNEGSPPLDSPCSDSSDSSIEFAGQRGFVRQLTERRADFLDDEDDDF
jgi:hypothetical protein